MLSNYTTPRMLGNTTHQHATLHGVLELRTIVSMLRSRNVLAVLFCAWILNLIYRCTLHPLARVPGPRLAKLSELWRTVRYFKGTWHDDVVQLHRRYGDVVRIAPGEVSFVDTAALKKLYGHGTPALKVCLVIEAYDEDLTISRRIGTIPGGSQI